VLPSTFQYHISSDAGIKKHFNTIKGQDSRSFEILVATDAG